MAALLVSVRSAEEAAVALEGGADVMNVKEPSRGPLGRADTNVWRDVRVLNRAAQSLSVALGELVEWRSAPLLDAVAFEGFSFRKLGLAGSGAEWAEDWRSLRARLGDGPQWVAVAYSDWEPAAAPLPRAVLEEAIVAGCAGILIDTFAKTRRSTVNLSWRRWVDRAHEAGLFVALAGGLAIPEIKRLAPLAPDLFAVRGAACVGGRQGALRLDRVRALAEFAHGAVASKSAAGVRFARAADGASSY